MTDLVQFILFTSERLDVRSILDILIIAFIFFWLLVLLRGTTAMSLLRGIVTLLLLAFILGNVFQLTMLNWLLKNSFPALLVLIPVLFQPELRRALERIGRTSFAPSMTSSDMEQVINTISGVARSFSERRFGALLVLERETGLQEYTDSGVPISATASVELLMSIFFPNSPLHDGAVILRENRIVAASCVLPLSDNARSGPPLGTRHRAAIGITELTDAISVVVSEETGTISICTNGRIVTNIDEQRLKRILAGLLKVSSSASLADRWRERVREGAKT